MTIIRKHNLDIMVVLLIVFFTSCKKNDKTIPPEDSIIQAFSETVEDRENLNDKKGELYTLVEGAVDTWFFNHLHDYRSYEPLIRSTDYNAVEDYYIHKCRYRATTLEGGYETEEKIFKVKLDIDSSGLKDFKVEDITHSKNVTEKD